MSADQFTSWSRRGFATASAASCLALLGDRAFAHRPASQLGSDRLVLLGTRGGPAITGYRPTPSSNLIVYKGVPYVIDAGYGASLKLIEAGIPLRALRYIFITHHHSDHNLDLGPMLYNAWASGLTGPVDVFGPKGLDALLRAYWESNIFDIETRIADEGRPDLRRLVIAHEFGEGLVFARGDVKVTSLRVLHPPVTESYALRFELGSKVVVFSGDTAYFPPLATFAKNADYLVHEVVYPAALGTLLSERPNVDRARLKASILSHHTTPENVGRIAAKAGTKAVVLNHFVPADDKALPPETWERGVRSTYAGKIIVGQDLMTLPL